METPSLENLPRKFEEHRKDFNRLEQSLKDLISKLEPSKPKDELLTVDQAADFLNLATTTIYSKVSNGQLPVMKRNRRLYFSRTELMEYLRNGRQKTNQELEEEAEAHLSNIK